jgi:hypothetical protein
MSQAAFNAAHEDAMALGEVMTHICPMENEATKIANLRGILSGMRRELEEAQRGDFEISQPALRRLHEEIANREQALRDLGVEDD